MSSVVSKLLKPDQVGRVRQILLQQEGLFALGNPDVAPELGLSDEHKAKFAAIAQQTQERFRALHHRAEAGGAPQDIQRQAAEIREEQLAKIEALLTGLQPRRWQTLLGQPRRDLPPSSPTKPKPVVANFISPFKWRGVLQFRLFLDRRDSGRGTGGSGSRCNADVTGNTEKYAFSQPHQPKPARGASEGFWQSSVDCPR